MDHRRIDPADLTTGRQGLISMQVPTEMVDPSAVTASAGAGRARPLEPRRPTAITAAAARLSRQDKGPRAYGVARGEHWQADAWEAFEQVGEQRFLATTLAGRMSQARLYVGVIDEAEPLQAPEPVDDPTIRSILSAIGPEDVIGQIVNRCGVNLFIVGEVWLAAIPRQYVPGEEDARPEPPMPAADALRDPVETGGLLGGDYLWRALSVDELTVNDDLVEVSLPSAFGRMRVDIPLDELLLIRVWRQHPRHAWDAESPTRSSLPVLRELIGLTKAVSAQVDSRLAGAGLLILPESAGRALRESEGRDPDDPEDPLTEALIDVMDTAIQDRSSASARTPLVLTVPDESADRIRHISFAAGLDSEAKALREEAIHRLAIGQDAPPELLLGVGGMNHWGAWMVQEDTVTTHLTPPLAIIAHALTEVYLRPVMRSLGYDEELVQRAAIAYDVEHLIVRPNRGSDALRLHEAGVLSDEALREAAGFSEDDAPEVTTDSATLAPEVQLAFDMVRSAPSLVQTPGLDALVTSIARVLDGAPDPEAATDEQINETGEPSETGEDRASGTNDAPSDRVPTTDADDAPTVDQGPGMP